MRGTRYIPANRAVVNKIMPRYTVPMAKSPPFQKMMVVAGLGLIATELNKLAENNKDDHQIHDVLENVALAVAGAMQTLAQNT